MECSDAKRKWKCNAKDVRSTYKKVEYLLEPISKIKDLRDAIHKKSP